MSFICNHCGETWDKHPATQVACPDCKAKVGSPCVRPSGHTLMYGEVHIAREQVAVDTGLLSKTCPNAPRPPVTPTATVVERKTPKVSPKQPTEQLTLF
ncbi:zinc finger domain-containing protein [Hymenobacter defluvii]|uniref:DNA-binding phage zinc finger domain-containing protein n=1 Tax=Hymenobacter defluvii TaxID=2054411 RepID=A0ABS3TKG8_9BACT|nr:hypothetical protein [Hymenobacter defluvii]